MPLCTPMGGASPDPDRGLWVLDREASRAVDAAASERFGIPSIVLMENAALGLRERALEMLSGSSRVLVLAGPGNNGGDGFALARHLSNDGLDVRVLVACNPDRCSGDAATNLAAVRAMGVRILACADGDARSVLEHEADGAALVVDALLGTGLNRPARPPVSELIDTLNRLSSDAMPVLSVDVPSGLDCDTGMPPEGGDGVIASETVTFVAPKPGFLSLESQRWTGDVWVAGIGAPNSLIEELGQRVVRRGPDPEPASGRVRRRIAPPGRSRSGPAAPD